MAYVATDATNTYKQQDVLLPRPGCGHGCLQSWLSSTADYVSDNATENNMDNELCRLTRPHQHHLPLLGFPSHAATTFQKNSGGSVQDAAGSSQQGIRAIRACRVNAGGRWSSLTSGRARDASSTAHEDTHRTQKLLANASGCPQGYDIEDAPVWAIILDLLGSRLPQIHQLVCA